MYCCTFGKTMHMECCLKLKVVLYPVTGGKCRLKECFDGYYFKHQKGNKTLCIIVGESDSEQFIQVITNDFSEKVPFTRGNTFSRKGIALNIDTPRLSLAGKLRYVGLSSIKYDIMGPFKLFPMECSHGIISMYHRLDGRVVLNGEIIDFTDGIGYIEKDGGCSFPSSYMWIQANDFLSPCSIMAAVADIPFYGINFRGCICIIQYMGREYRLATYLGVRVLLCTRNRLILEQGRYRLEVRVGDTGGHELSAPVNGQMTRTILESASCPAEFIFRIRKKTILHLYSRHASFEYEGENRKLK